MCKHSPVQSLTTTELFNELGRWIPVIPRSPAETGPDRRSCQSRDTETTLSARQYLSLHANPICQAPLRVAVTEAIGSLALPQDDW
jgi:hypothetical protein